MTNHRQEAIYWLMKQAEARWSHFYIFLYDLDEPPMTALRLEKIAATSVQGALDRIDEIGVFVDPFTVLKHSTNSVPCVQTYPILRDVV